MSEDRDRIAALIRALRAKTVANGCTEAEALAAAAKLAELLARYTMTADEAELRATPIGEKPFRHEHDQVGVRLWKPAAAIAKLTGARHWSSGPGADPIEHTFFGLSHEVAVAEYLLEICARAMRGEVERLNRELAIYRPSRRALTIGPFLAGMADRLHERILALIPKTPAGRGLIVVRNSLIDAALEAHGINLTATATRGAHAGGEGYGQGRRAAEGVALNPGVSREAERRALGGPSMIAYGAAAVRQAAIAAQLGRSAGGDEPPPPTIRLTKAQFIRREVEDCRVVATLPTEDGLGVIRWGRRYVARPCHVNHPLNPGWVLVHDDSGALNHYERLFGRGENPALPGMPGPVRDDA